MGGRTNRSSSYSLPGVVRCEVSPTFLRCVPPPPLPPPSSKSLPAQCSAVLLARLCCIVTHSWPHAALPTDETPKWNLSVGQKYNNIPFKVFLCLSEQSSKAAESAGKMLKFIWGRGQGPTAERLKLQKELFNFSRNITYGFPHKPSCMGWDPELKLLAVGTKNGQIRVFGKPGVEIIGQLDKEDVSLVGLVWIPGEFMV